jgi:hypothetical protein
MEIRSTTLINAAPQKVWDILCDFDRYGEWNPFIKELVVKDPAGAIKVGDVIKVVIKPLGAKAMTFKPKVIAFEKYKRFSWLGHFIFSGLFDGEHIFTLDENADGATIFTQSEIFKGLLAPLFNSEKTQKGFEAMNAQLKTLSER